MPMILAQTTYWPGVRPHLPERAIGAVRKSRADANALRIRNGDVAERLKAAVLKTAEGETPS
jgi:hypothetical protein